MSDDAADADPSAGMVRKIVAKFAMVFVFLPTFFLVTGGSLGWWEAWIYCAILLVPMTAFVARKVRTDPDFLARRLRFKEGEKSQRRIISSASPLILALFVLPGLDRRFGWSEPPSAAVIAAELLVLAGYLGVLLVFSTNRWAGRTIATWPGQEVVARGPYAIVRHPMYASTLLMYIATPVALGSWWAVIPAVLLVPAIVARILDEERILVRDLPGYAEYRSKVRYRLVPFLW